MWMKSWILLAFLLVPGWSMGQLQRILHQTFQTDSVFRIQLGIDWEITTKPWAGNNVLTETEVKLYDGSIGIFEHAIAQGRYQIAMDTLAPGNVRLRLLDKDRFPIRTKKGECFEEINLTVYVPDRFELVRENIWLAPESGPASINQDSLIAPGRKNN